MLSLGLQGVVLPTLDVPVPAAHASLDPLLAVIVLALAEPVQVLHEHVGEALLQPPGLVSTGEAPRDL